MNNIPKPYKILIEASKLYQPQQDGVKRYVTELIEALLLLENKNKNIQIDLLFGKNFIPLQIFYSNEYKQGVIKKNSGTYSWEIQNFKMGFTMGILSFLMNDFPNFNSKVYTFYRSRYYPVMLTQLTRLGKGKYLEVIDRINTYDLIHIPLPQNVLFFDKINTKLLVTIHDISHKLFPDFHTKDNIKRAEKGMQLSLKKKSHFISVSYSTQKDFTAHYSIQDQKINVIPEGVNINKFKKTEESILLSNGLLNTEVKYFLCLGTLEPRKNLINTIKAFESYMKESQEDIYLIVVGGKGWKNREIKKELKISSNQIWFEGFVEEEKLNSYYSHAIALIYPSLYEGFGLPLLESLACGTPVIYGNNSSMPEVVQDGGIPVNANNINSIKGGILLLLDENKREKFSKKGLLNAKLNSWEKMAYQTFELYENLILV